MNKTETILEVKAKSYKSK